MTLAYATAALVSAGAVVAAAAPLRVTVSAPGHAPKVNTRWNYSVKVTQSGKLVPAKISEAMVDPIGGSHPVEFGTSTKNITNWAFNGVFKDFIIWPASSRGIPLTLRITVKVGAATKVVEYTVTSVA
jgi:hypothetical protein